MNGEAQAEPLDRHSTQAPRRRRRPGENRERLIQAGIEAFGWLGYHGASTASIGRQAEVPQPHIYANFTTKQALFLACVSRIRDEWLFDTAETAPPVDSADLMLRAKTELLGESNQKTAHRFATDVGLTYARLLLQAITVSNDLSDPQLDALLLDMRSGLGRDHLQTQLAEAAGSLLTRREIGL